MKRCVLLPCGHSAALEYACTLLQNAGITLAKTPCDAVTHLLLPIPSFEPDGSVKGGGDLNELLSLLPESITVIGGNLHSVPDNYPKIDLLQDPVYLANNAAITAHCAIKVALHHLPCTLENCPVLVIGWGRIGKCLSRLLRQLDARITVAARKETDRATLLSLGYNAIDTQHIAPESYRVIFNTAPFPVLPDCNSSALKIDLASSPGITGSHVIQARGLPGKYAPESSGKLIAEYIMKSEVFA